MIQLADLAVVTKSARYAYEPTLARLRPTKMALTNNAIPAARTKLLIKTMKPDSDRPRHAAYTGCEISAPSEYVWALEPEAWHSFRVLRR